MRNVALLMSLSFIGGCGYTPNSSIDDMNTPEDQYGFTVSEYCSPSEMHLRILTVDPQQAPRSLTVDGEIYNQCVGKKSEKAWVRYSE